MGFAALAPAVSHALAAAGATTWVEVCTAQGMRWVAVADEAADASNPTGTTPATDADGQPLAPSAQLTHCPACTLGHLSMAPPPSAHTLLPLPVQRAGLPTRFEQAARTAHVWQAPPARAPPARA